MFKQGMAWQVAFTYIGTIIGAGFASGQEILKFFGSFGYCGVVGTMVSGFLFAVFGAIVVQKASVYGMEDFEDYLLYLFGEKLSPVMNGVVDLFLLAGLVVMLVAGGAIFYRLWGLPSWVGFLITAAMLYVSLFTGIRGVLWLNTLLIPCLLMAAVCLALLGIVSSNLTLPEVLPYHYLVGSNWLLAAMLYVGYNLVLSMVILTSLGPYADQEGIKGIWWGGLSVGFLALLMCLALLYKKLGGEEIPMLVLAYSYGSWLGRIYGLVLWVAIFTTALSNGWGLLNVLSKKIPCPKAGIIAMIFLPTLPFCGWTLGQAVEIIYPLLGYFGLFVLTVIMLKSLCERIDI